MQNKKKSVHECELTNTLGTTLSSENVQKCDNFTTLFWTYKVHEGLYLFDKKNWNIVKYYYNLFKITVLFQHILKSILFKI